MARPEAGTVLVVLGGTVLLACLAAAPARGTWSLVDGLAAVGDMLRGRGWLGDVAQDLVGFRRLVEGRDPYPILGPALGEIGVDWPLGHASTHPPTAFLLVAPVAFLPLAVAGQAWCLLGFGLLYLALRCYGAPWKVALGLALLGPLWKPIAASFHNLTLVWLAGVGLAYRFREGRGLAAGIGLGLASLSKLLPVGVALYFLRSRKARVAVGLLVVWGAALAIIAAMNPRAIPAYWAPAVRENAWATIFRETNSSLLRQAHLHGGIAGLGAMSAYLLGLSFRNGRALLWPARTPDYSFFLYSFLAVALLPISWGYSAAPLLPVLGYFALRGRAAHVVLATAAFLSFEALPTFGAAAVLGTLGTSLLFWPSAPPEREGDQSRAARPMPW